MRYLSRGVEMISLNHKGRCEKKGHGANCLVEIITLAWLRSYYHSIKSVEIRIAPSIPKANSGATRLTTVPLFSLGSDARRVDVATAEIQMRGTLEASARSMDWTTATRSRSFREVCIRGRP